jgi:hypothetical protein
MAPMPDTLTPGQTVRLSQAARDYGIVDTGRTGKLSALNEHTAVVIWAGLKYPRSYAAHFIEPAPPAAENTDPLPSDVAARFEHVEVTDG